MRRYALFCGSTYYPCGGWDDFHSAYDTAIEARTFFATLEDKYDWFQIVDLENGEIVKDDNND